MGYMEIKRFETVLDLTLLFLLKRCKKLIQTVILLILEILLEEMQIEVYIMSGTCRIPS